VGAIADPPAGEKRRSNVTDELTPEQMQAAQEAAAKNEALLLQVIQGATMAERTAAARALGILAPENVTPPQTRVVLRMVRTSDGKWWGGIEGKDGVVSQVVLDDAGAMQSVMASGAALVCNPLMTDEEHAAQAARLQELGRG
jgi:hypothetical protein